MPAIIVSDKYGERLCEALGIDTSRGMVGRIVIDVRPGTAVKVYVEMFGTDRLLDVQLPTTDLEIIMHG